jgi:ArsR family transcriptional regulator
MGRMLNVDLLFEACADATRRRVLLLLLAQGEMCVCDLLAVLELPQPKVSRHLAVLREAEIVASRRKGTWIYYRLNPELPLWAVQVLSAMADGAGRTEAYQNDRTRLEQAACGAVCCN